MPLHHRKVLAIDASTERCTVALSLDGKVSAKECDIPKSHAKVLLPMIDELLVGAQVRLDQLDAIALTLGPGSFTGVRICLSVAQGLAYGASLPCVGCNSLELLAQGHFNELTEQESSGICIACLDARMDEVYWAAYKFDPSSSTVSEVTKPIVSSPEDFNRAIEELREANNGTSSGKLVIVGHGASVEGVILDAFSRNEPEALPNAKHMFSLWTDETFETALAKAGLDSLEPLYLRNEVAWEKRQRIRTHLPELPPGVS